MTAYRSNNNAMVDDDDLELPVVRSKPLSSADSIAKFHRVRIVGVGDDVHAPRRRPHASRGHAASTSSSASTLVPRHRRRPSSTSSASSSSSTSSQSSSSTSPDRFSPGSAPSPFTTPSKARTHQRPKYHSSATAKKLQRHNRLSSLVLHSVSPREASPNLFSAVRSPFSSSSSSSSYTEYDVVVENVRSSQIWQVSRRFSAFVQFRQEVTALFAVPHCHHCTDMNAQLDALHDEFPAKRLWGSRRKHVTSQRALKLQQYLHGLLLLASKAHTKQCRLIAASFAMHLRGFLTVESTRFHGIPGGDMGHSIPSLLQELSVHNTGAVVAASAKRRPLATILEHVPSQSMRASPWGIALLEKDEDAETEDEEDESPSHDNQR